MASGAAAAGRAADTPERPRRQAPRPSSTLRPYPSSARNAASYWPMFDAASAFMARTTACNSVALPIWRDRLAMLSLIAPAPRRTPATAALRPRGPALAAHPAAPQALAQLRVTALASIPPAPVLAWRLPAAPAAASPRPLHLPPRRPAARSTRPAPPWPRPAQLAAGPDRAARATARQRARPAAVAPSSRLTLPALPPFAPAARGRTVSRSAPAGWRSAPRPAPAPIPAAANRRGCAAVLQPRAGGVVEPCAETGEAFQLLKLRIAQLEVGRHRAVCRPLRLAAHARHRQSDVDGRQHAQLEQRRR